MRINKSLENADNSYRQIFKATSLFGGVQIFNIIIQIIRSKVIAILLGPGGMGVMGLITSTVGIITSLTNFGLGTSAVKDIAEAANSEQTEKVAIVIKVFRRLVWFTGALGSLITLILAKWLSKLTFGNEDYSFAFVCISITLLFTQLTSGQLVILQGLRKLRYLAKANLLGSALGLIFTIPLYYKLKINGIVPGIIISSVISLFMTWFYARKISINSNNENINFKQTLKQGGNMLKMGFMISLSGLLGVIGAYVLRIFINRQGGVEQVGLYTAGFSIINTYVGLIFNAMATDYYPRLSSVSKNNDLCKEAINQQAEIAILILAPILLIFLTFINLVIVILFSNKFIAVNGLIYWSALGMFFKGASWSIGFIFLAKSAGKLFFLSEVVSNIYLLALNIIGYHYWGLSGIGFSFLISYILVLFQVYIISKIKYEFSFTEKFKNLFILQFSLAVLAFLTIHILKTSVAYLVGTILIIISLSYSVKELDKRIGLLKMVLSKLKR